MDLIKCWILRFALWAAARQKSYHIGKLGGSLVNQGNHWEIYFPRTGLSFYCGEK